MPRASSLSTGGFSSDGGFSDPWGSSTVRPYKPRSEAEQGIDTGVTPGGYGIDITSPSGFADSVEQSLGEHANFMSGIGSALFGKGNDSLLGGIPGVGDVGRFSGEMPQFAWGWSLLGSAGDIVGGGLERVPANLPGDGRDQERERMYAALPADIRAEYDAQIAAHPDIKGHLEYQALREGTRLQQDVDPQLAPYMGIPRGSLADTVTWLLGEGGILGVPQKAVERSLAGAGRGSGNRLQEIASAAPESLNAAEAHALEMYRAGDWSQDQVFTYLAEKGTGLAHDPALQITGTFLTDPTIIGSVGAAGLAGLGRAGVTLAAREAAAGAPLRLAGPATRLPLIGRLARTENAANIARLMAKPYAALEGTTLGRAAKLTRYLIDPLHNIGQHRVAAETAVDTVGGIAPRAVIEAHGDVAYTAAVRYAASASPDGALLDMFSEDLATYSANLANDTLLEAHQASMLAKRLGSELVQSVPGDIVDDLVKNAPRDIGSYIKQKALAVRAMVWDEAAQQNLAERMVSMYGVRTIDEFADDIAKMSDEQRALWHAMTFARATKGLIEAKVASKLVYTGPLPIDRMIWLNANTLSDIGAKGILKRLNAAKDTDEAVAVIREAQAQFPELKYISIDAKRVETSVRKFEAWVTRRLEEGAIPHQVTHEELGRLTPELKTVAEQAHEAWTLGFRPTDDLRWSLDYELDGGYRSIGTPWVDDVANVPAYRPAHAMLYNVAGQPLVDKMVRGALAPVDYAQAAIKTMKAHITTAQVTESARVRFAARAVTKYGMSESEAKMVFEEVVKAAGLRNTSARGLLTSQMWKSIGEFIPKRLYHTGVVRERELMNLILDAYEGDLRFVGLTQKLTGRAKTLLEPVGGNAVGFIAENLYPTLKFRINLLFQTQERIEPVVLNSWRGAYPSLGVEMSEADRVTQAILDRLAETGVTRISDIDQWEFTSHALAGTLAEEGLKKAVPRRLWDTLTNVQGAKRTNLLRTVRKNLGLELRSAMDRAQPGLFDQVADNYAAVTGKVLGDDEVALRWVSEQMFGNDVTVSRVIKPGARAADFDAAIKTAYMHLPTNIGELKSLELDFLAKRMAFPLGEGRYAQNANDLRAAIAANKLTLDDVAEALDLHGFPPDYVRRVEGALSFSWDTFWGQIKSRFNLEPHELKHIRAMMVRSAEVRGMTPVDFLSQVFSPYVESGAEATINELGKAVSILRTPFGKDAPRYGVEELTNQMADVFLAHLDPSGREALLAAFERELPGDIAAAGKAGGQKLQATLENLRGGWQGGDWYASGGRIVDDAELGGLQQRGRDLVEGTTRQVDTKADIAGNLEKVADELYQKTATSKWGGATYSPRLGKYAEVEPWMYHGTMPSNMQGIKAAGMRHGSNWIEDQAKAQQYALGKDAPLYRAKPMNIGGTENAPGWRVGGGVKPKHMQVSRDKGTTWGAVDELGDEPGGPWSSAIGETRAIGIAEAQDPEVFKATLREFAAEHEDELRRQGNYIGTFRDDKKGVVEFDVVTLSFTKRDTEAIQAAYGRTGGAYDFESGNGLFAPRTAEMAKAEETARRGEAIDQFSDAVLTRLAQKPEVYKLSQGRRREWLAAGASKDTVDIVAGLVEARAKTMGVSSEELLGDLRVIRSDVVPDTGAAQLQRQSSMSTEWLLRHREYTRGGMPASHPKYQALRADIEANGIKEPVILDIRDGKPVVLDGHHRLRIARELGITEVPVRWRRGGSVQFQGGIAPYNWDDPVARSIFEEELDMARERVASFWGDDTAGTMGMRSPRAAEAVEPVGAEAAGSAPRELVEAGLGDEAPLEMFPLSDGRQLAVPGGLEGEFSLWDAWRLKAQQVDPNLLDDTTRIKLYEKLFRTQQRALTDPVDTFNRIAFAQMSPNLKLLDNEAGLAGMRVRSVDDIRAIAEMPADELRAKVKASGAAAVYPRQLQTIQANARRVAEDPEWFAIREGEDLVAYSERVMSALDGAGMKVGNFAAMLGDPLTFDRGTIDSHMVAMLVREGLVPDDVAKRLTVTAKSGRSNGEFLSPKADLVPLTLRGKPNPAVPEHLRDLPFTRKDGKVVVYGNDYKVLSEALDAHLRKTYPDLPFKAGGSQWFLWDMERKIIEPHTTVFPGAANLERLSPERIKAARDVAKDAGYYAHDAAKRVPYDPAKGAFWQPGEAGPRGFTVRQADETIIGLTTTADPSTAIHETWHGILEPSLTDTQRVILESHGAVGEKGARLFERYLSSGKAPTTELRRVFAAAKRLLVEVYARIKGSPLKARMHPEVKAVFDEMLTPAVDPDVERAVQQFSKWSQSAVTDGLLTKGPNPYSDLLRRVSGIETDYAAPFNRTHQLLVNQAMHAMRQKEQDAFRLQYFARERTWAERSINHPFFGIYPASYMWGKIAPELIRFMAKEPFGVRTGAMAYLAGDVSKSVAAQRELDPEFDKVIEGLGHSQAVWFMGYLLPAVPWDISAAVPAYLRDVAQQGLENQQRVDRGLEPEPINLMSPVRKVADYISPFRSVFQTNRALEDVFKAPEEPEAAPTIPSTSEPLKATELGPTLDNQMRALQEVLADQ